MNKNTYNSLKAMLEEVAKEAQEKGLEEAKKGKSEETASYCKIYYKICTLKEDLKKLIEEGK